MEKINGKDVLKNDVLCGLLGKNCHCSDHDPLEHFGIVPGKDVEISLTINGVEVTGVAGFIQAYFRQYEKLIASRVREILKGDLEAFEKTTRSMTDLSERMKKELEKNLSTIFPDLKTKEDVTEEY